MEEITKNEKETFEFAKKYASKLKGGEILGLVGNLGSGKTVFSKGIAAGLGIKEEITSPTFVYMKIYEVNNNSDIKKMCHIDAYRVDDEQMIVNIGALEYFNNPSVVTIIEWVDKFSQLFKNYVFKEIVFEYWAEKRRILFK